MNLEAFPPSLAVAGAAGLASSFHCATMCGPLAAFAGGSVERASQYHAARLIGYAALGSLAGLAGPFLLQALPAVWVQALTSWGLSLGLAWAAARLWRKAMAGKRMSGAGLIQLHTRSPKPKRTPWSAMFGEHIRRLVRPQGRATRGQRSAAEKHAAEEHAAEKHAVKRHWARRLPTHPLLIGGLTGLLPCGALYAALLIAASSGGPASGAASMVVFGVTSSLGLGALSALSLLGPRFARAYRSVWVSRVLAVMLAVGATMLVIRPMRSLVAADPHAACHTHGAQAGE